MSSSRVSHFLAFRNPDETFRHLDEFADMPTEGAGRAGGCNSVGQFKYSVGASE